MAFSAQANHGSHPRLKNAVVLGSIPPLAEGHAILLPEVRTREADSFCRRNGFSVSVRVRKGRSRSLCQDTAVSFVCEEFAMLAVLDGYQNDGHLYSFDVSRRLLELCRDRAGGLARNPDARALLMDSAEAASNLSPVSGTTAIVALVLKSRDYFLAGVGDSAAYGIKGASVRRMLDYGSIVDPQTIGTGAPVIREVGSFTMDPDDYAYARDALIDAISSNRIKIMRPEIAEGRLGRGAKLALVSDGVTKNLIFSVDGNGSVTDVSGNADLADMLRGVVGVRRATHRVLSEVEGRAAAGSILHHVHARQVLMPSRDDTAIAMVSCD